MSADKIMKTLIPEIEKHLWQIDEQADVNYCELSIKIHNGTIYTESSKKTKSKY